MIECAGIEFLFRLKSFYFLLLKVFVKEFHIFSDDEFDKYLLTNLIISKQLVRRLNCNKI